MLFRRGDQRLKKMALAAHQQQKLRMPLHADQKGMLGVFDGLNDAVEVASTDL